MAPLAPGRALDDEGKATKTDIRNLKRAAAARDEESRAAYEQGRADAKEGHPRGHRAPLEPHLDDPYNSGYDDEGPRHSPEPADAPSGAGGVGGGSAGIELGQQGASALLGVVAYALVLNYLAYGWPGVTGWLSAKFLNKVTLRPGRQTGTAVLIPNANPGTGAPAPQTGALA